MTAVELLCETLEYNFAPGGVTAEHDTVPAVNVNGIPLNFRIPICPV